MIRGQWAYLYRAVDASGATIDFRLSPRLSPRRSVASAEAFFRKAVRSQGRAPESISWMVMLLLIVQFANFNCKAGLPS